MVPLTRAGVPSLDKVGILEDLLARSVPTHIFVLPQNRVEDEPADQQDAAGANSCFELKETIVVKNLGFTKPLVKSSA